MFMQRGSLVSVACSYNFILPRSNQHKNKIMFFIYINKENFNAV